jgi:glyoxylase-like metal-dependent hydrolase (beta-lactamase superfamily II)
MTWYEVGERCFRRRYSDFDVTVGVIVGADGTVVVDTRASVAQGVRLRDDLRELGVEDPTAVVNTHGHFDHCFGNAAFAGCPRWGHASLPGYLAGTAREMLAREFPVWARTVAGDLLLAPDEPVRDREILDLGDRTVELRHLGRGHTDGDLVAWVPDAGCVFAGDLVEESGPPAYGADAFPLEWPDTLGALLAAVPADVVVPGHGEPVGRGFVDAQREEIAQVAAGIRGAHAAGASVEEALAGDWPYDPAVLGHAVRRGYAQLNPG